MKYILVPIAGDPFLFRYWLNFYDTHVSKYVDKVVVGQYGPTSKENLDVIRSLCDERDMLFASNSDTDRWGAGESLEEAFNLVKDVIADDDVIILLETDCYIFDGSIIDQYTGEISSNKHDLIASDRSPAFMRMNVDTMCRAEDTACDGLWPNFVFCSAKLFKTAITQMNVFMEKNLTPKAQIHESLFHNCFGNEEFVSFAVFLRHSSSSFKHIPQLRGSNTFSQGEAGTAKDVRQKWIHFGTLECQVLPQRMYRNADESSLLAPSLMPALIPLKDNPGMSAINPAIVGMYKAIVEHGIVQEEQLQAISSRYVAAITYAEEALKLDVKKINVFRDIYKGWIKSLT